MPVRTSAWHGLETRLFRLSQAFADDSTAETRLFRLSRYFADGVPAECRLFRLSQLSFTQPIRRDTSFTIVRYATRPPARLFVHFSAFFESRGHSGRYFPKMRIFLTFFMK